MRSAKLKLKPLDEKNGRLGKHGRLGMSDDVESSYAMDPGDASKSLIFLGFRGLGV